MKFFPIFLNVEQQRIVISGAGACAVSKLRLLLKSSAEITVYGPNPDDQILTWVRDGRIQYHQRQIGYWDLRNARLVYGANDDQALDQRVAKLAKRAGVLFNIVDNLEQSQFITPAIVDRDPLTIAIGTEGAAPVLARDIKRRLEDQLPNDLGLLARLAQQFRPHVTALPYGKARRAFWADFFGGRGHQALNSNGAAGVNRALHALLGDHLHDHAQSGHVHIVGAGPGDPELLTLKARNALHDADVILHDQLVPLPVLELARREAQIVQTGKRGFGPSWSQDDINALMVKHANAGKRVVRLKSGDPTLFARLDDELDALRLAKIPFDIIPGITAASAASAAINQSLTKRGRNSAIRFITGQDMHGFCDHDWRNLIAHGAVTAVYMGKRAARQLQARLLMHGGADTTPITIVQNASQPNQRIIHSDLAGLADAMAHHDPDGPAVILLGLAPGAECNIAPFEMTEFAHGARIHS